MNHYIPLLITELAIVGGFGFGLPTLLAYFNREDQT